MRKKLYGNWWRNIMSFLLNMKNVAKGLPFLHIGWALQKFRHGLNKFYVQPDVSPFNWFGFIIPNEWKTFQQLHTTPEAMVRSNRMKELIRKNKFKHRLRPGGYMAAIPLWTKKEQELREAGIPNPLESCMLHMRNWIQGRSRIDDNGQLITSNSNITRVIENAKDLITKGKMDKFKPRRQKDQLSIALKTEEHWGHTRAVSSIASWKEGFMEDNHMYKKRGRHDIDAESVNNKDQFAN
jgi:hypothetical protein